MTAAPALHIHHWLPASLANGPGRRAVVWTQGCTLGCPGCFNPETHPALGGSLVDPAALAQQIAAHASPIEGVTISGGEPLQQAPALLAFLAALPQSAGLSVILFTGYTRAEVDRLPAAADILGCIDVLIAGRYAAGRRIAAGLIGSSNKTVHFLSPRYSLRDLAPVPQAEVLITPSGELIVSGIDPLSWNG